MHQPQYDDPLQAYTHQPWTYLHAIKDYVDMAAHLESVPGAKVVVNFAPILLEQIEDYGKRISAHMDSGQPIGDPLLDALVAQQLPQDAPARLQIIKSCLRAHRTNVIERFPAFLHLVLIAEQVIETEPSSLYLTDQYIFDLLTWYHLAWMGETVRRADATVIALSAQASAFTHADRMQLLGTIFTQMSGVLDRYAKLAQAGQVELAMTPYAHPITPLLIDLTSVAQAMPDVTLPQTQHYPGGLERSQWHIDHGRDVFERFFGLRPQGCWPAEGSVSDATLALLEQSGFVWAASGEQVLRNSWSKMVAQDKAQDKEIDECHIHQAFRLGDGKLGCFFRDDGLSDAIGFTYSDWHADDAVGNLIHHLENIAKSCADRPNSVVSIILDGENAWEHYPHNGFHFLQSLYQRLAKHPYLEMTTFSACMEQAPPTATLPSLVAGSWVYGTFSTWIGDTDKNRAWEMLVEAKLAFDEAMASGQYSVQAQREIARQLAICEGSDWFWWFGDYNPAAAVRDFDQLFRLHLTNLYKLMELDPPQYLARAFAQGGGDPQMGGVMRRGTVKENA